MTTITLDRPALVSAPPRCNFAGFCGICGLRGCASDRCITRYAATWWAVCAACDGRGDDGAFTDCRHCLHGVFEVNPGYPGAVQAR